MMYTENKSQILTSSTSVPLLFSNSNPRISQSNYQSSFPNHPEKQKTISQGFNFMKTNSLRMGKEGTKKEKEVNSDLSSSLSFTDGKKNVFTHYHQTDDQTFKFQFKRNSAVNSRLGNKLNQSQEGIKKQFHIYSQYAIPTENNGLQPSSYQGKQKMALLQDKIKDLQNRLKFEEKYANDLYINSEEVKQQLNAFKEENAKQRRTINDLIHSKQQLQTELSSFAEINQKQNLEHIRLREESLEWQRLIKILEDEKQAQLKQIEILSHKVDNFSMHYKNELYQERIKQLNQQIRKTRGELTQAVIEKNRLQEQLKVKNEKLAYVNYGAKAQLKSKTFSATQKTNQAINLAFQQSIKIYKAQIIQLKGAIQRQVEERRLISEENFNLRRQISMLQEQERITAIKYRTQIKNTMNENDRKMTQKINEINSLNNKLGMLQERYGKALKEINDKDDFLQKHLVGRAKDLQQKQYIQQIMQSYQQTFQSRLALQQRIKQLERCLLNQ